MRRANKVFILVGVLFARPVFAMTPAEKAALDNYMTQNASARSASNGILINMRTTLVTRIDEAERKISLYSSYAERDVASLKAKTPSVDEVINPYWDDGWIRDLPLEVANRCCGYGHPSEPGSAGNQGGMYQKLGKGAGLDDQPEEADEKSREPESVAEPEGPPPQLSDAERAERRMKRLQRLQDKIKNNAPGWGASHPELAAPEAPTTGQ